jgi:hypothetical protein
LRALPELIHHCCTLWIMHMCCALDFKPISTSTQRVESERVVGYNEKNMASQQVVDRGVKGLETHGEIIHDVDKFTARPVKDEEYGSYIRKTRNLMQDQYLALRILLRNALGVLLATKAMKAILALAMSSKHADRLVNAVAALALLFNLKANGKGQQAPSGGLSILSNYWKHDRCPQEYRDSTSVFCTRGTQRKLPKLRDSHSRCTHDCGNGSARP